jgi:hypothetical protein
VRARSASRLPLLFALAVFLAAAELFLLEPMLAKMLLPRFGGAPAVWTTSVLFFQVVLLAAYGYAHLVTTRLQYRHQVILHVALLVLSLALLPIALPDRYAPTASDQPAVVLLVTLAISAGLPFFVISSTAPLLQRWFADAGHRDAGDPYYLYAASNAGSLVGLFVYPLLFEPRLTLSTQSTMWMVGYCVVLVLVVGCARQCWRTEPAAAPLKSSPPEQPLDTWTRVRWMALAFTPASLMLGCTSFLSGDVAAVPLLWIGPLALYLLSFIFAFSQRTPAWLHRAMICALPVALLCQLAREGTVHLATLVTMHLATLFVAAMVCHGELARTRPSSRRLTEFYLWIAFGGALGSCFNALVAPVVFSWPLEYPLALALAAFLLPPLFPHARRPAFVTANRVVPLALGCAVAGIFLWKHYQFVESAHVVHEERTFFGVHRIVRGSEGKTHTLMHGSVRHGMQIQSDDSRQRRLPMLYYFPSGPIGQVFFAFRDSPRTSRTAVIGLGVGSLASYAEAGQEFTFYEIDPAVARIARDTRYFTYLVDAEARGTKIDVVLGDARLSLQRAEDRRYSMIVLDAFSGDAIPAHLLTREAVELYKEHLDDDGVLALHITNDYLELEPVVAGFAADQQLVGLIQRDTSPTPEDGRRGKTGSVWVVLARERDHFGKLNDWKQWKQLRPSRDSILWRDDYTNLVPILRWN